MSAMPTRPITLIVWRDAADGEPPDPSPGRDLITYAEGPYGAGLRMRWDDTRHALEDSVTETPYWWTEAPPPPDPSGLTLHDLEWLVAVVRRGAPREHLMADRTWSRIVEVMDRVAVAVAAARGLSDT
jgi:hypothetical protein